MRSLASLCKKRAQKRLIYDENKGCYIILSAHVLLSSCAFVLVLQAMTFCNRTERFAQPDMQLRHLSNETKRIVSGQ